MDINEGLPIGVAQTRDGLLPHEWELTPLGDLLIESNTRLRDLANQTDQELPILSLTRSLGLILQSERFGKRIATQDLSHYKVVRRGEVVYNPYVIWEGAVHALRNFASGLVSPAYPVWSVQKEIAEPYFVDELLRMPQAISAYNKYAAGAVNRRRAIRKRDFLRISIPLPPLAEQRAIVGVLSAVRGEIDATEAVIEAARALRKSLMRYLFTFGPVATDRADDTALRETDVGLIPKDWETLAVSEVVALMQYGANTRAGPEGAYPILRMNNLTDGRIDISNLKYVDLDAQSAQRFKLEPGDLLFNRTNSLDLVGKTSLFDLPEHFVFASYLIRVKCNADRANPRFLNAYMNWDKTQSRLRMLATRGVGQSNISASKLRGLLICLPPADVQSVIAGLLHTVDRKIDRERYRRECLGFLFKSLLRDLMTGRIRVDGESA
jgi:type I restriction enzyme S subunit